MKQYLIQPSKGIIIGVANYREQGWSFTPFTSAHGGSRKAHMTKEAAALRYSGPSCRWIATETINAAVEQVKALKAAYDRNEPCSGCKHYSTDGTCARGAAPTYVRNLGKCAKYEEDSRWAFRMNQPHVTAEEAKAQREHLNAHVNQCSADEKAAYAYARNEPCSKCLHIRFGPSCAHGASPTNARNNGKCDEFELGIPCPKNPSHPYRQHPMQCCVGCDREMDAAIMHTISDTR